MSSEGISVLIPTTGRKTLAVVLSQCTSHGVKEVVILDSGEIPSMSSDDVMIIVDMLHVQGKTVKYIRSASEGIGRARWRLIQEASCGTSLFLDDDVLLSPESMYEMFSAMSTMTKVSFVVPKCFITTNFLGVKGFTREKKPNSLIYELSSADKDHMIPYYSYENEKGYAELRFCGTQAILFNTEIAKRYCGVLKDWKKGYNREDVALTYILATQGRGICSLKHTAWHLETDRQVREWKNADEEIGYMLTSKGDFTAYTD